MRSYKRQRRVAARKRQSLVNFFNLFTIKFCRPSITIEELVCSKDILVFICKKEKKYVIF